MTTNNATKKTTKKTEKLNISDTKNTAGNSKTSTKIDTLKDTIEHDKILSNTGRKQVNEKLEDVLANDIQAQLEQNNGKSKKKATKKTKKTINANAVLVESVFLGNSIDLPLFKAIKTAFNSALRKFEKTDYEFLLTIPIVLNMRFTKFPNTATRRVLKAKFSNTVRNFESLKGTFENSAWSDTHKESTVGLTEIENLENALTIQGQDIDTVLSFDVDIFQHWKLTEETANQITDSDSKALDYLYNSPNVWFGNAVADLVADILPSFKHLEEHKAKFDSKVNPTIISKSTKPFEFLENANEVFNHLGLVTTAETFTVTEKNGNRNYTARTAVKFNKNTAGNQMKSIIEDNQLDIFNPNNENQFVISVESRKAPSNPSKAESIAVRCSTDSGHFTGLIKVIDSSGNTVDLEYNNTAETTQEILDSDVMESMKYGSCFCGKVLIPVDTDLDKDYQPLDMNATVEKK